MQAVVGAAGLQRPHGPGYGGALHAGRGQPGVCVYGQDPQDIRRISCYFLITAVILVSLSKGTHWSFSVGKSGSFCQSFALSVSGIAPSGRVSQCPLQALCTI